VEVKSGLQAVSFLLLQSESELLECWALTNQILGFYLYWGILLAPNQLWK